MQQRLRHVESQLEGPDRVTVEGFQNLTSQVEQLDQTSRAANIMVFGLPEQHGPDSSSLADTVGQQLHDATAAFSPSAIVRAHRLGTAAAAWQQAAAGQGHT